ncbi:MAG TPA: acyl-CoA dehydrogenase family protein, partial [Dongiaceae bacterium]|nr:acyl-CoA dehydrogenase family protein [Dongiaceae bacterium]
MDFFLSDEIEQTRLQVRDFVQREVIPLETDPANFDEHENLKESVVAKLREKSKALGLWGFQVPKIYGGRELGVVGMAALYEEAARSPFGPVAFNCAPPDDGNMMV